MSSVGVSVRPDGSLLTLWAPAISCSGLSCAGVPPPPETLVAWSYSAGAFSDRQVVLTAEEFIALSPDCPWALCGSWSSVVVTTSTGWSLVVWNRIITYQRGDRTWARAIVNPMSSYGFWIPDWSGGIWGFDSSAMMATRFFEGDFEAPTPLGLPPDGLHFGAMGRDCPLAWEDAIDVSQKPVGYSTWISRLGDGEWTATKAPIWGAAAADCDGAFIVGWSDDSSSGGGPKVIKASHLSRGGAWSGANTVHDHDDPGSVLELRAAALPRGGGVASWLYFSGESEAVWAARCDVPDAR